MRDIYWVADTASSAALWPKASPISPWSHSGYSATMLSTNSSHPRRTPPAARHRPRRLHPLQLRAPVPLPSLQPWAGPALLSWASFSGAFSRSSLYRALLGGGCKVRRRFYSELRLGSGFITLIYFLFFMYCLLIDVSFIQS